MNWVRIRCAFSALVLVLTVAGLIPRRYPKQGVKKA